jgi:hypothetical protein
MIMSSNVHVEVMYFKFPLSQRLTTWPSGLINLALGVKSWIIPEPHGNDGFL